MVKPHDWHISGHEILTLFDEDSGPELLTLFDEEAALSYADILYFDTGLVGDDSSVVRQRC